MPLRPFIAFVYPRRIDNGLGAKKHEAIAANKTEAHYCIAIVWSSSSSSLFLPSKSFADAIDIVFVYNTSVVSSSFFVQCYWIINEIGLGDPPHYFYGSVDLQKAGTMGHNRIRDLMYANNLDILDVVSIFVVWMNGGTLYTPECFHPNW